MTKSVCVIGNSHLAAVKLAWDEHARDYPHISATMFGSPRASLRQTRVKAGKIVPTSDIVTKNFRWTAKTDDIDLAAYASFHIVACQISTWQMFNAYRRFGYFELKSRRAHLVSKDSFRQGARERLAGATGLHLARLIRKGSGAPIQLCKQAFPSEACVENPRKFPHDDIIKNGDIEELIDLHDQIVADLFKDLDVEIVPQPSVTVARPGLTKRIYSDNSVRLREGLSKTHGENDYLHMNGLYGAEVLKQMFPR